MSFATFMAMVSGKKPIWLYRFDRGTDQYFYTSAGTAYNQTNFDMFSLSDFFAQADVFSLPWNPTPIGRGAISRTSSTQRATLDIVLPRTSPLAIAVRDGLQAQETLLTVYKVYDGDAAQEAVTKFIGRVVGVKPGLVSITLSCENQFTAMRRKILASTMQRLCNHAQYYNPGAEYAGCKLSLPAWQVAGTATALSNYDITVTEAGSYDNGYFSGGILQFGTDLKFILKHSGTTLTMLALPEGFAAAIAGGSQSVSIAPGCNLTFQMCSTIYKNTDNFGGLPGMTDNPFDGRNPF